MKLSIKEKISYGIGAVGKDMVYMLTASYILYYYEDILGVSAVYTGILLLAARVFDAANDPVMGVLVARTKSRFGKFRPWLFSGTVINALVLYAMFAGPEKSDGTPLLIYISAAYILWGVTYTMMDIPYWSMIPAFARDSRERESLSTLGRTCAGAGSALVTVITMPAVYFLGNGDERTGFKWFALIVAVFFAFTAVLMCLCIREKSTVDMPVNSIGDMFRALVRNDQAMTVVISIVLINTFGGAVQIMSMMLLYPLIRKFLSTVQVFCTSLGMAVAGYAVLLILACTNMSNMFMLFIPGFFIFGANGLLTILTTVFLANSVDYGQWKNGSRDESVIFSMQTFVVKLASGVAVLLASICLAVFQISENTEVETMAAGQSVMGLRLTMTVLPVAGLAAAAVLFTKKFKLTDEKMEEIGEALRKEENKG